MSHRGVRNPVRYRESHGSWYGCGRRPVRRRVGRTELADFLCEEFDFHDARGHPQRDGCLKALRELEASGHFTLPEAQGKPGPSMPKRLAAAVADPTGVPPRRVRFAVWH